jgi:hypothetical protein
LESVQYCKIKREIFPRIVGDAAFPHLPEGKCGKLHADNKPGTLNDSSKTSGNGPAASKGETRVARGNPDSKRKTDVHVLSLKLPR